MGFESLPVIVQDRFDFVGGGDTVAGEGGVIDSCRISGQSFEYQDIGDDYEN